MAKDRWGVDEENIGTFLPSGSVATKPNYTTDTISSDLAYAIKQNGADPMAKGAADRYAESLLNRIGSVRGDGTVVSKNDVIGELNRLGYRTEDAGDWTTVGGQQYLTGGKDYDNLRNIYAQLGLNRVNIYGGNGPSNYVPAAGYTIGHMGMGNGSSAGSGNSGSGNGWDSYMSAYQEALNQQLEAINGQKAQAAKEAENQKRQAYVSWKQAQKALKNQLSASGLNDSGYSETSNIALSADYGNQLGTINQNYNNVLQGIDESYAQTALSGAGTLANLAQQEYANRVAQQQWQAQQEQQAKENAWYEQKLANELAQQELENSNYGKLILIDGKKMLVYDGEIKTAESAATVPTVLTNATPNEERCGGSVLDDLNRLTPRRYVEYYATADMLTSTVKLYSPDGLSADGWIVVEKLNEEDEWVAVSYTKDTTNGYVSIASGQLSGLLTGEGKSNLRLGYEKALKEDTTAVIHQAMCGKLYGVNGNTDRLFLSGADNKVYYSDVDDLLSYPENNYITVGADSSAVMGFSRIQDSLGVHKEDNGQDASVFLITGSLNAQGAAVFSVKSGVNGAGAVSRYGFAEFAGEPVFVTANGLYALTTQEITFERYAQVRSFYVNPRLVTEELSDSVGCVYNNYYYLAVGDKCYVADGRQKVYESNAPMSAFQYEWYYFENVPARVWWQYEGSLYFGTEDGKIKRFFRAGEHSPSHNAYRDDDVPVKARWDTPYLYFDRMNHYKNLKNFAVMLAPYGRSGVKIFYRANGLREMVKQANADIFSFEDIDFERFTFHTDDAPMIIPTNRRLKKFMLVQFRFENDLAEPFGLYGFAGMYTVSSKYKG